jgi:hypothetical protein
VVHPLGGEPLDGRRHECRLTTQYACVRTASRAHDANFPRIDFDAPSEPAQVIAAYPPDLMRSLRACLVNVLSACGVMLGS